MKMWLKCMILLCAAYKTVSDEPTVLTITKISLGTTTTVYFSDVLDTTKFPNNSPFLLLIGSVKDDVETVTNHFPKPAFIAGDTNIAFDTDAEIFSEKDLVFTLTGTDAEGTETGGEVDVVLTKIPNKFTAHWVGNTVATLDHGSTLRIAENVDGWTICQDGDPSKTAEVNCKTGGNGPCYAVNVGKSTPDAISLCAVSKEGGVPVLVKSPDPAIIDISSGTAPAPSKITLEYDTAKLLMIGVEEALVYNVNGIDICESVTECTLKNSFTTPGKEMLNIILVNNALDGSSEITLQDYKVEIFELGTTILEARWTYQTKINAYTAVLNVITGDDDDSKFHTVKVDCTDNYGLCYAYYTHTTVGTVYTVGVHPDETELNGITSVSHTMGSKRFLNTMNNYSQVIDVRINATSITEQNTEVDVCFGYVGNASTQGTHYEFLAINSKGMWKKFLGEKKIDKSHACFYALELLNAEFDENSKFLVLLRDATNGNVLSSGDATLNLQALRAIKPEVDNGNNGSTSTMTIVGAAIAGIACLMALVAAAVMFVMKIKRDNDGLQYPLHRTNIEQDSSYIHGLDNPIPTM